LGFFAVRSSAQLAQSICIEHLKLLNAPYAPTQSTQMTRLAAVLFVASSVRLVTAASAQVFAPPSQGSLVQTANYTSFSNNTLKDKPTCMGKAFNRIIQIWLENTDFAVRPFAFSSSSSR
jgi:hypothetical protein